jgi:Domain of unknown function (DUF1707)
MAMDAETRTFPRGDIRVSDAERDLAVSELSEHFQAGRLTQEEFDERSGRALKSRTVSDLNGLFTDLPRQGPLSAPPALDLAEDPFLSQGDLRPSGGGLRVARAVIAFVVVAFLARTLLVGYAFGYGHGAAWLLPVVILALVFLRLALLAGRRWL